MRKTIITVTLLFLLVSTVNLFSQTAEWYVNKPIKEIRFIGLNNIDESDLKGITDQFTERSFSDTLFWDLQSKLYSLNYFESFTANAVPTDEEKTGVIIEFTVTERPLVRSIIIRGNKSLSKNQILEVTNFKTDDILNNAKIRMDVQAIKALYTDEGYPDAEVESSTSGSSEEGFIDLIFTIVEGSQIRIKTILFSGNTFASDNTLKGQLKSKEQSFFTKGVFKEDLLDEDRAALLKYYQDSGYIDAKVLDTTTKRLEDDTDPTKNFIELTFFVEEGEQWTFGGYKFEGNKLFDVEELLKNTGSVEGKIINRTRIETDFIAISDTYYNEGYIYNTISRNEIRDEQNKTISYEILIEEKSRAHIENITIKGNDKTKDYVILRELPLEVGDVFSKSAIMQGLNNLYNTQYFTSVVPEMPYGSEMGLMDLLINVEEKNTTDIQFGMTFTASAGTIPIVGFLKWSDSNFLGEGKNINVGLSVSPSKQEVTFGFKDNWLFDQRLSAGIDLSFSHNLYTKVPQDKLYPVFDQNYKDNPLVVPDPYDGHYVYATNGLDVPSDVTVTQSMIDSGQVVTDYAYAVSKGIAIPTQYLMEYESYIISLAGNGGYTFITPIGRFGLGTALSSSVSYSFYEPDVYRPYDQNIRDSLKSWRFKNQFVVSASWDTRDLVYSPTSGFLLKETFTYTGGFLLGHTHYLKTVTDLDAYFKIIDIPVTEEWNFSTVLGFHSQFAMLLPQFGYVNNSWGWNTVATREDLLYYDGMFIARGWGTNYDNVVLWDSAIDLTTPIVTGMLSWNTFLSGTAAWNKIDSFTSMTLNDFKFSLGTGIQIDIPSFPISFFLVKRFKFTNGQLDWQQGDFFTDVNNTSLKDGLDFVITFDLDYF